MLQLFETYRNGKRFHESTLHMLSRRKKGASFLPWLLVPFVFVGTAIGVVLIVAAVHH